MKPQDKELKIIIKDTFYILGSDEQKHDKEFREHTVNTAIKQLIAWRNKYAQEYADKIIGDDYIFERPQNDYLPNVYQFLKGKNDLRAEQRKLNDEKGGEL